MAVFHQQQVSIESAVTYVTHDTHKKIGNIKRGHKKNAKPNIIHQKPNSKIQTQTFVQDSKNQTTKVKISTKSKTPETKHLTKNTKTYIFR